MKIGIVGSRGFGSLELVREYVRGLDKEDVVISGGARGVDSIGVEEGKRCGLGVVVVEANWNKYGKSAGMIRNKELVMMCDRVVVFWDGVSSGSKNMIDLCKRYSVKYEVIQDIKDQLGLWG